MQCKRLLLPAIFISAAFLLAGFAQSTQAPSEEQPKAVASQPASQESLEMTSHEETVTFRSRVDLVLVPVVVRDAKGHTIGNLRKDDFRVYDEGKPQIVTYFSAVTPEARVSEAKTAKETGVAEPGAPTAVIPKRFLAYLVDDLHTPFEQIVWMRQAADKQLSKLRPEDRIALFTSSGRNTVTFTDSADEVRKALTRIAPQSGNLADHECPDLGAYWADMIESAGYNQNDPTAKEGVKLFMKCLENKKPARASPDGQTLIPSSKAAPDPDTLMEFRAYIERVLALYDKDASTSLTLLRDVVARMSMLPGVRSIVMVSPGFLVRNRQEQLARILDRAAQQNVIVNTLDPRGVDNVSFEMSNPGTAEMATAGSPMQFEFKKTEANVQAGVLEELADGTGGVFFHGSNDLEEGFSRITAAPEYSYLLGFSPHQLKQSVHNGEYRRLKVTVMGFNNSAVHARRAYFVYPTSVDPTESARKNVESVMFSSDQAQDIPMQLHTEFFKTTERDAKLSVAIRMSLTSLPLRKVDGRNRDDLLFYASIFDRNGNYVTGKARTIEMRLRDESLTLYASGINVGTDFILKSGSYLLRVVVSDTEGQLMSAVNKAVQIP